MLKIFSEIWNKSRFEHHSPLKEPAASLTIESLVKSHWNVWLLEFQTCKFWLCLMGCAKCRSCKGEGCGSHNGRMVTLAVGYQSYNISPFWPFASFFFFNTVQLSTSKPSENGGLGPLASEPWCSSKWGCKGSVWASQREEMNFLITPYRSSVHITCHLRTIFHRLFLSKVGFGLKLELLCCNYVNDAQGNELVSPRWKSWSLYFLINSTFVPDARCAMKRDSIFFILLEVGLEIMRSTILPCQSCRARHIAAMLIRISGNRKTLSL